MKVVATCLLLFITTAGSKGGRVPQAANGDEYIAEMSLEDLERAENPMNLRAYSGICNVNYVKVGCYKEKKLNRALPEELFQDRKSGDPNYSGQNVNWADYKTYLKGLACRCAEKSQQKGFTYFGLQDYGRCFSGPHATSSYNTHGGSDQCSNYHYQKCDDNAWGECVGKGQEANYVYQIKEGCHAITCERSSKGRPNSMIASPKSTQTGSGDGEIGYGKAYDGMDEETKQR